MGNSNDNKLISTAWLGVNDDWKAIMRDRISWINQEWAQQIMSCLDKCLVKQQERFKRSVQKIITETTQEQISNLLIGNENFLKNNEYLREDIRLRTCSNEQSITISTSQSSMGKINESSYLSQKNLDTQQQSISTQQYYIIFELIYNMINSNNHPFYFMIDSFQKWMNRELIQIQQNTQNILRLKSEIHEFGLQINEFINLQIFALNEYLGDLDEIQENKYLKDKQNYYNLFLALIINETQTIQILDILKIVYHQNINKIREKIAILCNKTEFFEIPKQYLNKSFQIQIDCLTELQFLKNPAEKYSCLVKTHKLIKEQLGKSASSLLLLHYILGYPIYKPTFIYSTFSIPIHKFCFALINQWNLYKTQLFDMHQQPLLIIDSRHTLYDSRTSTTYKYNAILNKTFQILQQHFQVLVLFCHNKPDLNEFYHKEFQKQFTITNQALTIQELQQQHYDNDKIIILTHDYKNFTIKQSHQLIYYSSLIQKANKKQLIEEQYYLNNNQPYHVSHVEQVLSNLNQPHSHYYVGYYFYPKKQNELIRYEILISNQRVCYVPIDFRFINKHQKINFLFHKLMDIYKSKEINLKQQEVILFRQNYELFVSQNPQIQIIDQIKHLDVLIQRDLLNDKLDKILQTIDFNGIKIMTPKQIGLNNLDQNAIIPEVKYPIIVKSKQGALCANCHIMAIVVNDQGMKGLLQQQHFKDQLILQEIINHNSTIYKIYQLGERMIVQKRKSIPNIEVENFKFAEGFYVFDTQKDLFTNVSMCLNKVDESQHVCADEKDLYTQLEKLSKLISQDFDLKLFGFDIIGLNSEYYIIDINHFPGYKNVDGLREQFEQMFIQYK